MWYNHTMCDNELTTEKILQSLSAPLLTWYRENARDLPWRRTADPYRIWVSEIMLQQTRVAAVLGYYARFLEAFPSVEALAAAPEEQLMKLQEEIQWQELSAKALEIAKAIGAGIVSSGGFIGGVVSGVSTFVISLIFSFYVLLQKEKLGRQGRQVIYGLLPLRQADRTLDVLRLSGRTFSSFLSGQCLEACILGTLFVAAMTIFRMPYALLVGVLIALTALIPIVGAFIGCAVGALLIAIDDPWKALWFIVLFLVLQQIEGNLIYPHVVGSSVGLPSIWVLAAVTLGGKLMGITGMLFFIPLCSVIYALFRSYVKNRLVSKAVPPEKWRDPPPPPSRQ